MSLTKNPQSDCAERRVDGLDEGSADCAAAPTTTMELAGSLRQRLRHGALWVIAGRILGVAATVSSSAMLARELSPDDFGRFLLINTIMVFGTVVAVFGLNNAGIRFIAVNLATGDLAAARWSFHLCLLAAGLAAAICCSLMYLGLVTWGDSLFHEPTLRQLAPLIAGCVGLFAGMMLVSELLRGFHELRFASLLNGPSGGSAANCLFIALLATSLLFVGRPTLTRTVLLQFAAVALVLPGGAICLFRTARARWGDAWRGDTRRSGITIGQLLAVSVPLMLTQVLMATLLQVDLWIASRWFTKSDLALYGAARRMMVLVAIPTQMVALTVLSSIPELYAQGRVSELQLLLQKSATLAGLPSLALTVLLIVAPGWALSILFGNFYAAAAGPLVFLALGQLVATWVGTAQLVLALTGHHNAGLVVNVISTLAFFLIGPLAAQGGMLSMAMTSASIMALQSIAFWLLTVRLTGVWTNARLFSSLRQFRPASGHSRK
jgi:O-antigen/teichoic acid export membrane protein